MGKAAEYRENAIAAFQEAQRIVDQHGEDRLPADAQRDFDAAYEKGQRLMKQYQAESVREGKSYGGAIPAHDSASRAESVRSMLSDIGGTKGAPMMFPSAQPTPSYGGRPSVHRESWGDAVVKALSRDGYASKDILSPSGTVPVTVPLRAEPVSEQQRAQFLRQLVPTEPAPNGHFAYMKQTVRTLNAAVVAPGSRKPTSIITSERVDDTVDTIAHLSEPIRRQDISDAPMLRRWIDDELRYGLDLALDAEIIAAILAEATAGPGGADELTAVRTAITVLQQANFDPTGIVLSPGDWESIELLALEQFAANSNMNPVNSMTRRLFGVPVVVTTALADGDGVIGDFRSGATLYMTEEARVDWSESIYRADLGDGNPGTDFERNMVVFRAELRAKTAVLRPPAFVTLALGS